MRRLGHNQFYAQGGDFGSMIITAMSQLYPEYVLSSLMWYVIDFIYNWVQLKYEITHYNSCPTLSWWRHQMETFSALLALCAGNSAHKGQWRGALIFSLICAWINNWVNNGEAGDLRRHRSHYDVIVMLSSTRCTPTRDTSILEIEDTPAREFQGAYSDVTWLSWCFKSRATRLFVQQLTQASIKGNTKGPRRWPFVRGIHRWSVVANVLLHGEDMGLDSLHRSEIWQESRQ